MVYKAQAVALLAFAAGFYFHLGALCAHALTAALLAPYLVAATVEWAARPAAHRDARRREHATSAFLIGALATVTLVVAYTTDAHRNLLVSMLLYVADWLVVLAALEMATLYFY